MMHTPFLFRPFTFRTRRVTASLLCCLLPSLANGASTADPKMEKQSITPAVRTLIDRKIRLYTKAECVIGYSYSVMKIPQRVSTKQVFDSVYKSAISGLKKGESWGQSFESGRTATEFWTLAVGPAGNAFGYFTHKADTLSVYSCKPKL